ncbi:MAG: hypothetical protein MK312_06815 [Roseibacillus sp.]|nr:hypothetical protein [Roseibacillus sp.]
MLADDFGKMKLLLACALTAFLSLTGSAHPGGHYAKDPFRQLDEILPDPNEVRGPNGAPGPEYWQQRADYKIKVVLDDQKQRIIGSETITYTNNSRMPLNYLWVQLDQNRFEPQALGHRLWKLPISIVLDSGPCAVNFHVRVSRGGIESSLSMTAITNFCLTPLLIP